MQNDPTLPGIPQDAIDHAANVERARLLVSPLTHDYAAARREVAEALTAAEARGFAKGVESVTRHDQRPCTYDEPDNCPDGAPKSTTESP